MEWERLSTDGIERRLVDDERLIARLRARQVTALAEMDRRQVATSDGSRSLSEWTAARLDVAPETARSLVRTMRRVTGGGAPTSKTGLPEVRSPSTVSKPCLASLNLSVSWSGPIPQECGGKPPNGRRSAPGLRLEPLRIDSWSCSRRWTSPGGSCGAVSTATRVHWSTKRWPKPPTNSPPWTGLSTDNSWRRATALIECLASDDPPPAQVTVVVDAKHAAGSGSQAGVVLEPGSGVGREALDAILHERGFRIELHPDRRRIRFQPSRRGPPVQHEDR